MSKQSFLRLANVNLFQNSNDKIEFSLSRDNRVVAQYSSYDTTKGYDVRGVRQKVAATGKVYIRLSFALIEGDTRSYFNGALFKNERKTSEKQPDYRGTINLDNQSDGPKLSLSAWIKNGTKSGDYLSISISEYQEQDHHSQSRHSADSGSDAPAPAPARAPAAAPARAPARAPAAPARAPAPAADRSDYDDTDFPDAPF